MNKKDKKETSKIKPQTQVVKKSGEIPERQLLDDHGQMVIGSRLKKPKS
jgi:hypothetical protein